MIVRINDDFDFEKIAESGQCFRWRKCAEGGYLVEAGSRILVIRPLSADRAEESGGEKNVGTKESKTKEEQRGASFEVSCTKEVWDTFWSDYFDLGTVYSDIRGMISEKEDPYLAGAARAGCGIRILKQDPWETLISFIISQRKSIPAIKSCIEKLCRIAGRKISREEGTEYYAFPTPEELAVRSDEELSSCGLGYRTKYVSEVSKIAAKGDWDVKELGKLDDAELIVELMRLPGVGIKVASCVLLFGFHRLNVFPRDVWINRVLSEHYEDGFPLARYAPYCGVMQQYLFYGRRQEAYGEGHKSG